jgi:hypothetical protein
VTPYMASAPADGLQRIDSDTGPSHLPSRIPAHWVDWGNYQASKNLTQRSPRGR